ncbi:MAG: YafY family transcriptional regulator [Candidatus Synoicihabitans palmerolidicus]|nr:YafY family transcriptional regulator [Candidatus Synoicihabitans palmerolidicus]
MVLQLQGRRVVRAEELAGTFEISLRTVYRDIAALGEAGVGYRLAPGYHLPPVMFTADEALALAVGEDLVRAMTDASIEVPMAAALGKIRSVLPADHQDALDRLRRATSVKAPRRKGGKDGVKKLLLPVQRAAIARSVLRMRYLDRKRVATTRDVEPLGVIYFNDAWYAVTWCRMRKGLRHFRVDRMVEASATGERFAVREDFSLERHIAREARGHGDAKEVVVRLTAAAAERLRMETWTEVQLEREEADGAIEMVLGVPVFEPMVWWILAAGGEVEAIYPDALRRQVAEVAGGMVKKTPMRERLLT